MFGSSPRSIGVSRPSPDAPRCNFWPISSPVICSRWSAQEASRRTLVSARTTERGFKPRLLTTKRFIATTGERTKNRGVIPPDVLLQGYRLGIFPMAMDDGEIEWFSPNPRAILPLDHFIVPHGLQRVLR